VVPTPLQNDDLLLHRTWNKALDSIRVQRRGVAAHLGGVLPALSKDGATLILELPAEASTSRQYLEKEASAQLLKEAVAKAFDKPLAIRLTLADANNSARVDPLAETPEEELFEGAFIGFDEEPSRESSEESSKEPSVQDDNEPNKEPCNEPSKEELESILSASLGSQIQFEE